MDILIQITYILGFSLIGQYITLLTKLPIPGSVIGLILFFIALKTKIVKLHKVEATSKFLNDNLALFFVPAGVGILVNFQYIKDTWLIILLICFITTLISLVVVGLITQFLLNKGGDKENE